MKENIDFVFLINDNLRPLSQLPGSFSFASAFREYLAADLAVAEASADKMGVEAGLFSPVELPGVPAFQW